MDELEIRMLKGIEQAMKAKKWTKRALSRNTDIPYRSIQNYLSGKTKMPAIVYIKICNALGIDNQYVMQGNFELHHMELWDALWDALGHGLISVKILPRRTYKPEEIKIQNTAQANASKLALAISASYDKVRKERLGKSHIIGSSDTTSVILEKRNTRNQKQQ